jgi:hypothetical protein
MSDPVLAPGQYSIGTPGSSSAYVFGGGVNGIYIAETQTDTGTINVQDQAVVGHDGLLFGVDTLPGMVITQNGQVYLPGETTAALDAYSALAGVWNDPNIRLVNGAVQVLRSYYAASNVTRRTYGRGRKIMPTYGSVWQGLVPFTSQFQSADNTWYEDTPQALTLTMAPSYAGGLTFPVTPPFQWASQVNSQSNVITNTGSMPTWPVLTFTGPISYPELVYVNTPVTIGYQGIIPSGQSLVIDTRPWARTALLNGASVAGNLSGDPMISLQLPPGATEVAFSGQDFTGTSTCLIQWYSATLAIGGSS